MDFPYAKQKEAVMDEEKKDKEIIDELKKEVKKRKLPSGPLEVPTTMPLTDEEKLIEDEERLRQGGESSDAA
jgi:hypothetical protein